MIDARLLIMLLLAHFIGDYSHLVRPYMLAAKRIGSPLNPIFQHATIHASMVGVLLLIFFSSPKHVHTQLITICYFIVLFTHFIIDVAKGKLNKVYPALADNSNTWHWYLFGLDQFLHIIIIIFVCYLFR